MDIKSQTLDPKQQEAFSRIMTTPTPMTSQPSPATINPSGEQNASSAFQTLKPTPPQPTAFIPQTSVNQNPLPSPATVAGPSDTSTLLQIVYIVGALVFLAVYTIFWIKVFNLTTPLPF